MACFVGSKLGLSRESPRQAEADACVQFKASSITWCFRGRVSTLHPGSTANRGRTTARSVLEPTSLEVLIAQSCDLCRPTSQLEFRNSAAITPCDRACLELHASIDLCLSLFLSRKARFRSHKASHQDAHLARSDVARSPDIYWGFRRKTARRQHARTRIVPEPADRST